MYSQFVITIFILVLCARQWPCLKFNEKLLKSGTLTNDQLKQVCGISNVTEKRIVGGENATLNAWPWMAAIYVFPKFRSHLCGGSLISNKYVLTAAHCVHFKLNFANATNYTVRLGDLDLISNDDGAKPEYFQVNKLIPHEKDNNDDMFNDVGLLELATSVTFSQSIIPICLPDSPEFTNTTLDKMGAIVIGWGASKWLGKYNSMLQQVKVGVIPIAECQTILAPHNLSVNGSQICAGGQNVYKGACQADSGGPLMMKNSKNQQVVVGIVSGGTFCNDTGVYTRVSSFLDWIKKNTGMSK